MARGDPAVVNFNGGEVSPLMYGRTDYDKYSSSAQYLENFIPSILGPVRRRPGSQYVGNPKYNGFAATSVVLIPFSASTSNEFVLEVGPGYTRFWDASTRLPIKDDGATWSPYVAGPQAELATPWAVADLYTKDEHNNINGVGLQWAQSNDVMWIACRGWPTVKLTRTAQYEFSFAYMGDGVHVPTPFEDTDPLNTITIQASAFTGAGVTLTASAPLFTAADVATYIYLEQATADIIPQWEASKAIVIGDRRRSNGRNYIALNASTTGTSPPSHSVGARYDGNTGVWWDYTDDGYGTVAVTGFTDSTHVTVEVQYNIPSSIVSNATTRWARSAWRGATGYPSSVAFFRQRLCFARDNTVWASVSADFENFIATEAGQVTLDLAYTGTLAADKNDRVLWLYGGSTLTAGTASGEWAIGPQTSNEAFGPGNAQAVKHAGYGSIQVQPIKVDNSLLYMQRGGNRLRELTYDYQSDSWISVDRSQLAEHMAPQYGYLYMAHQRQPESVVWVSSASGRLYSMTYDKAQNVYAWARHRLGGFGIYGNGPIVSAMTSVKSPDGVNDDVWMLVSRYDASTPNTTLEIIGPAQGVSDPAQYFFHELGDTPDANFLDCSLPCTVLAGAQIINVNTLAIVQGSSVGAILHGCVIPDGTTASLGLSIDSTADIRSGRVGYRYLSNWWSLPLQGNSATGTPQGKVARIRGIVLRVYKTVGFVYGISPNDAILDRKEMRTQDTPMNNAVQLQNGDFYVEPTTAYVDQPTLFIQQDQPLPLTIVAAYPKLTVEDSR
jgi:hypothetical protein